MASALLDSRNEPYWGERKAYMKKIPNYIPNPRLGLNSNPNPNPNSIPHTSTRGIGSYEANQGCQKEDPLAGDGPALSVDSSSFSYKPIGVDQTRDFEFAGASLGYFNFSISSLSKKELRDLKRRLISELEQVRCVTSRIESREIQSSARSVGYSTSGIYCSSREFNSPSALQNHHLAQPEFYDEKEIKASEPKMEHLLPLQNPDLLGQATSPSPRAALDSKNLLLGMMKKCSQILCRLMKHKGGLWFNSPVDVQGMGLHDYRLIIKYPMDLGTVKFRLKNGFYKTPLDFAEDIRLTFNNALIYNPETHEVHKLAALFLRQFESLFGPAYAKYEKQVAAIARQKDEKAMCSSWPHQVSENPIRADIKPSLPSPPPAPVPQHRTYSKPSELPCLPQPPPHHSVRGKLPKPKAKEPNKRPMSYEERQKLSFGLQSLPEEKMNQVLQIVKKRNVETQQDGDEIVLDFETMDAETLWELDRFLCNCKKMLSKIKRREALLAENNTASSIPAPSAAITGSLAKSPIVDDAAEAMVPKRGKKTEPVDEDIDIGEEMTSMNYPSVEIEKDDGRASSSSSSGSDSSSSSSTDSESGSSSGSGSDNDEDEDDACSPVGQSGASPRN